MALLLLALAWGVLPALPTLWRGELLGHGFTDLYPSVWGLWWFAEAQPGLPTHTTMLGFPGGMGFYYASPLKGWLAWPLIPVLGLTWTWNLLVLAARVATVVTAGLAARAWGLGQRGALVAAAVYGCAPFFHGYAVEGIVEGTDGWPLALLALALGRGRPIMAALALALTIVGSWYAGMCGCLLVVLASLRDRRLLMGLGGLLMIAPFLWCFVGAFPGTEPLPDAVRAAMGARPGVPTPGALGGLSPFAMNAYVGWLALGLAAWSRSRLLWLALVPAALSLGLGPLYDLPMLELVRFPYRWHAATLALVALAAGRGAEALGWGWVAPLIALEGLLLSPVEPLIPGADPDVPDIYAKVDGPLLELPGPVAMAPGRINRSRARARYLLYAQTQHGQPSPWVPDFNSVGVTRSARLVAPFQALDPLEGVGRPARDATPPGPAALEFLRGAGVRWLMVHREELPGAEALTPGLEAAGAAIVADDGQRVLLRL